MCKDCPLIEKTENKNSCIGYNPIEKIRGALFHWLPVPFNSVQIWMKLRCLNYTQIKSCGDISQINIKKEDEQKEILLDDLIEIRNTQEALVKASLVIPTFDEIIRFIIKEDFIISDKRKELKKINELLEKAPNTSEKKKLQKEIDKYELFLGILLPDDMISFITAWALGVDRTDIKKISRQMLLEAAILAKNGNDNPADHIEGVYTDVNKDDINKCAWIVYGEYIEEKQIEADRKKTGMKWVGGKGKNKIRIKR